MSPTERQTRVEKPPVRLGHTTYRFDETPGGPIFLSFD